MKLKSFNNFGNVKNVTDSDKNKSAPICIDLDDDSNEKTEKNKPSEDGSNGEGSTNLNTSRELVVYDEDVPYENKDITKVAENEGVTLVKKILADIVRGIPENGQNIERIVVDLNGVAVVKRRTVVKQTIGLKPDIQEPVEKIKNPVAPTIVLEEDKSPGDVVHVHEIDVDGDIVQVQEIAFDDIDQALEYKFKENAVPIPEQGDEIVILSDKEPDQKPRLEVDTDETTAEKLRNIPETVTVIKTPLRMKKNKRMIKSPFKRTNDLLCQKVDKMIRCGVPDIQLLRTLLNHLSENDIGGLLAKLVSSEELESMRSNFENIKEQGEALGGDTKEDAPEEKEDMNPNDASTGKHTLHKQAVDVCSKLPDGITVNVVSPKKSKDETTVKVANSVGLIDTIIQSEVSAAQTAGPTNSRSGLPLNSRSDSIVELDATPRSTPEKLATSGVGGLRIANIKTLLAPKDDIIIPEVPKQNTIRISDTVSLSKHNDDDDDDISIIEETLSPATITRNLPNVSISRSLPQSSQKSSHHRNPPPASHSRNPSTVQSHQQPARSSPPTQHPKPPNTYYDGRGKLRSSLSHKLVRLNIEPPDQNQQQNSNNNANAMPIPMNELIRRYLYPSGSGGVSVGTPMDNPWGLPRDLAMYEELLRTNMTTTTDNSQYAAYAAAYEELIKSYMSASPENYAKIVTKYNIFSSDRPHSDHNRPSTSRLTPQSQEGPSGQQAAGQTSKLSPHQRTPVIVSAASLKSKGQYKECTLGSGATLAPVNDREEEPQPGPSGVGEKSENRSTRKRNYKESSGESTSEESSEEDEGPSADEFVMEQAETDRMKAGRSRRRETDMSKKRRKGDRSKEKNVGRPREDGQGVCSKRRGKVTAMRHNPVRKGQVTVESTDSENDSETARRKRASKAHKEKGKKPSGSGSSSDGANKSRRQLFGEENSNPGFPRKTNINKAALKINRMDDSASSESWKKTGSSQEDLSSDEN